MVCLGNICRSTLAEGVLVRQAAERGIAVEVDSAGTGDWHVGRPADPRSIAEGTRRGCAMTMIGRQVRPSDFDEFDLILAMDANNERDLLRWPGTRPEKVRLIRAYDPTAPEGAEVPDPYYGDPEDFVEVADMLERACAGLLDGEANGEG